MDQPKRSLKINIADLEPAFESQAGLMEIFFYLDLETGEVEWVTREAQKNLEDIYEQFKNPDNGEINWAQILPELELQDWQKDEVLTAHKIEEGFGSRFISIPADEPYQGYNDMVDFIDTISNHRLQSQLIDAIQGRGAFRCFKNVLLYHPKERDHWFEFSNERLHRRILNWLESIGIEPI